MASTWFRIAFEHALTHCVSSELMAPLLYEMATRQHPIKNFEREYGRESAGVLGGNPRLITDWAFDLGGGVFANEPRETLNIDGLAIDVSCHHFSAVLHGVERLTLRTFSGGESYYKTKFWLHATVLTPAQRDEIVRAMVDRAPVAEARANAFAKSLRDAAEEVNS